MLPDSIKLVSKYFLNLNFTRLLLFTHNGIKICYINAIIETVLFALVAICTAVTKSQYYNIKIL